MQSKSRTTYHHVCFAELPSESLKPSLSFSLVLKKRKRGARRGIISRLRCVAGETRGAMKLVWLFVTFVLCVWSRSTWTRALASVGVSWIASGCCFSPDNDNVILVGDGSGQMGTADVFDGGLFQGASLNALAFQNAGLDFQSVQDGPFQGVGPNNLSFAEPVFAYEFGSWNSLATPLLSWIRHLLLLRAKHLHCSRHGAALHHCRWQGIRDSGPLWRLRASSVVERSPGKHGHL